MSIFIKAIFGHVSIDGTFIQEKSIVEFPNSQYTTMVKKLEEEGKILVSENRNDLLLDKSQGIVKSAEESLASLNPPLDDDGKELPTKKTIDFSNSLPIKPEVKVDAEKKDEASNDPDTTTLKVGPFASK